MTVPSHHWHQTCWILPTNPPISQNSCFQREDGSALQQINHWLVDKRSWDRNFCLFVLGNRLIVSQTFYYLFQSVKMMYPRQLVWTLYVFAISNKYIQSVLRLAASVSVSISVIISQKLSVDFRLLMKTPNDERISAQLQINVLLRFTGHS